MRHLYECPMRWADLDLQGHVNNVVYVDYLQEARADMLRTHAPAPAGGDLATGSGEGLVVVRHDVTYLAPLTLDADPVRIECWVTEVRAASFTMAYEIFSEDSDGGRTTFARATTVLTPFVFTRERPRRLARAEREALERFLEPAEPAPVVRGEPRDLPEGHYPLRVRFSDVDVYGHVNNVKYVEYFQEARIQLMDRLGRPSASEATIVVARTEVDYREPILFRHEPYDVRSWVAHLGRRSVTIESEILDGRVVKSRARVVVVFFDPATQRSVEPPAALRERLEEALLSPPAR